MSFQEVCAKYSGVDYKHGTDKTSVHSYGPVYDELFKERQHLTTSVLEIGIETGGSLAALRDYFSNAQIYGIDIFDRRFPQYRSLSNVNVFIGDALAAETIHHFATMFDIIIEDASHDPAHQKQHFKDYCQFVKSGGLYIIEDVHTSQKEDILSFVTDVGSPLGFSCVLNDLTSVKNVPDDIMIVCSRL